MIVGGKEINMFALSRIALVIASIGVGLVLGQEPRRCTVKEPDVIGFKYRVGRTERGGKKPTAIIQISVEPRHINETDLTALVKHLNKVFCNEPRMDVVIFDSYRYALNFLPGDEDPYYRQGLESMRGGYHLDRTAGEEFVEFTTVPNYFKNYKNRVRIDIGKTSAAREMKPRS
jgi:hypothetical protein